MDLDFYQFGELIDIRPNSESHFIHSMSEPFSEEDIEDEVMHNWLDHFKMQFHQLHASGHMDRTQLEGFVNYVKPEQVFPVHTENQHLFKEKCGNARLIEYGREYVL
jgi:mRNA degradation ribonuclease J1/J2